MIIYPFGNYSSINLQKDGDPYPVARNGHAAVCLGYGMTHGGLDEERKVRNVLWCLVKELEGGEFIYCVNLCLV